MRILSFLLGIGLCFSAPIALRAAGAAEAVLAEVSAAVAGGQYEAAITLAQGALADRDTSDLLRARLLLGRGLARQALGNHEDALADFTQGLSVTALPSVERAKGLFARGVSLDSLGRLTDALGDYDGVLKLVPGASYALNNRANVYRRQNRLEEARRDYLAALAGSNPSPEYPYYGLGQIAEARGDTEAARDFYNRALAAAPGFSLALERLQALGASSSGMTARDPGTIVLRPPPTRAAEPPIVLKAPVSPAVPPAVPPRFTAPPRAPASSGQGAPLRPAIVGAPASSGEELVQLGAWRSAEEARAGWAVARDRADGLLDELAPIILRAEIPGRGVFYRLRVRPAGAAGAFCSALEQKNLACIPAR
jgi:tetratricopeptide (TPR) repeat protein